MRRNDRTKSVRGTLRWFATFAVVYLLTIAILNLIMDRPMLGSMIGSAIGIVVVLLFILWWRHWRRR